MSSSKQLHAEQFEQFYLTVAAYTRPVGYNPECTSYEIGVRENDKWQGLIYLPHENYQEYLDITKRFLKLGRDIDHINKIIERVIARKRKLNQCEVG